MYLIHLYEMRLGISFLNYNLGPALFFGTQRLKKHF